MALFWLARWRTNSLLACKFSVISTEPINSVVESHSSAYAHTPLPATTTTTPTSTYVPFGVGWYSIIRWRQCLFITWCVPFWLMWLPFERLDNDLFVGYGSSLPLVQYRCLASTAIAFALRDLRALFVRSSYYYFRTTCMVPLPIPPNGGVDRLPRAPPPYHITLLPGDMNSPCASFALLLWWATTILYTTFCIAVSYHPLPAKRLPITYHYSLTFITCYYGAGVVGWVTDSARRLFRTVTVRGGYRTLTLPARCCPHAPAYARLPHTPTPR